MKVFIVMLSLVVIISCKSGPSDTQLQTNLVTALGATYPGIAVSVKDKVVTLTGTCPDDACKTSSEEMAKSVEGVKNVVNEIVVTPPAPINEPEITADDPLKKSVDDLVASYNTVTATVNDGVITLTGELKRSQLTALMQSLNELKPKKVENKLTIK